MENETYDPRAYKVARKVVEDVIRNKGKSATGFRPVRTFDDQMRAPIYERYIEMAGRLIDEGMRGQETVKEAATHAATLALEPYYRQD